MTEPTSHLPRASRALAATAVAVALILTGATAASATGSTGATAGHVSTEASLQVQAQELAGQIQADGRNLDQLAESLDAAQIRSQQLAGQLSTLRAAMARTDTLAAAAKAALKEQALLAYLAGGAPLISQVPDKPGSDPSLTISYAEIVAGGQHRAVDAYRAELADEVRQSKQLNAANQQAATTLADFQADRTAAAAAFSARQRALASVKGQLATLVAQVQAAQQQAAQTAAQQSAAQQGQLPTATPPAGGPPSDPTTVARPATTAAPTTPPSSTRTSSPPTTGRPTTDPPASPPTTTPPAPTSGNEPAPGWNIAVHYAYAQLGKPYQWGGAGPNSFDCSGLTMMAWDAAGVYFPHLAQDQYDMTKRIPLSDALPGDLIFYGTPNDVYHVGIYIGGGQMIDAPETGQNVSISSIYWANLLGAGRVEG